MTSKQAELDKIKQRIIDDKVCPELAQSATQLVFGDGSVDAPVVFIGEAPGKKEDEQGLPFVGAAGKFLNEMLAGIGLDRAKVYITNIVKYRPPENRDPLPDEKQAFLPYLKAQLDVIKPKLVVTLGRHSMEALLPAGLSISQCHGQPKRLRVNWLSGGQGADAIRGDSEQRSEAVRVSTANEQSQLATKKRIASAGSVGSLASEQASTPLVILPLFHPAAALYNGSMRQTLIDDFNKIPSVLAKIN